MPCILFVHQNYPAQFGALGAYLAQNGWEVQFATALKDAKLPANTKGFVFEAKRAPDPKIHKYLHNAEKGILNGQGFARAAARAKQRGFSPDIVMAHSGWGSGHFAKAVWPDAKFVPFFEWWYNHPMVDHSLPEPPAHNMEEAARIVFRNAPLMADYALSDVGLSPTKFQRDQFPAHMQRHVKVMHDGVDTEYFKPDSRAKFVFQDHSFQPGDKVVTYVARGLEPQRGFPQFMRALAQVMAADPEVHAVIAGADRVAYGAKLPEGESWKSKMLSELAIDPKRLHFTGLLPRKQYRNLLQVSAVHAYLSVPFCLSWSLTDAMSTGCALVVSRNAALAEVISDNKQGLMANLHDIAEIVGQMQFALENPVKMQRMRKAARKRIISRYAMADIYPAKDAWLRELL